MQTRELEHVQTLHKQPKDLWDPLLAQQNLLKHGVAGTLLTAFMLSDNKIPPANDRFCVSSYY